MSIASDIIDGEICAFCLLPFAEPQGFPCACADCWEANCGYEKSESPCVN
jgi:hypothetical protein